MELFPELELGLYNGWILIVFFYVAYGIILIFLPKKVVARLYDRSGKEAYPVVRRIRGLILMFLWFTLAILNPLKTDDLVFMIGISIYSLGILGFVVALYNYKNTPTDQPATRGIYRISRHPQQLSISLSFMGISIALGSWLALVLIFLGVIGAHYKILAEEKACLEKYGESYKSYMERIPRYFVFF